MDYLTILISVFSSGATASVIAIVAKKLIDRSVDHLFHEQESRFDAQITAKLKANDAWFQEELKVYPAVVELVYRCRNAARDCMEQEPPSQENINSFLELSTQLTDIIFKNRLIFSQEIFAGLHNYKKMVSQFAMNLNYKAKIINNIDIKKAKNESIQKLLREQWLVIDESHEAIIADIKKLVEKRTQI